MVEVKVPTVGESIQEVQIGQWLKREGEWIGKDENLVDLETEKASVQVPSPISGVLKKIHKQAEEFATVGEVIADIEPSEKPTAGADAPAGNGATAASAHRAADTEARVMPAAKRIMDENKLSTSDVQATGPGGRILKEDALRSVEAKSATPAASPSSNLPANVPSTAPTKSNTTLEPAAKSVSAPSTSITSGRPERMEEVKPLSMIRRTIATRLVQAQHNAALLTTFNEVDMQPVMDMRQKYRDAFQERHGVKLGFMSFFAKASVEALRRYPSVNAEMRGNNIAYRHYADIGIAIGGGKGLVVPVLRNVEKMSFADVERTIGDFARKAMENRLMPEDLEGGTFTISNGGIYGSLLSTPIVNPPQSAILGLHSIQERPIARDGKVMIAPMMYLALTYDHRIIDGREAVSFLKTIKEVVEDPSRLFLEV
ncbi:MAG: 2-oxoglutarate dehydrogenase complex dihydrolipoyllysine-residue succinyltransferase [Pirellulaceae bacterium]|nr:2-oxoglutarate dehydrogenase complex dihydrolipoyllysine-residue succinyltransferase [Pirellulaceae bacterium]